MKHIVFIVPAYYPRYSAVGYCCHCVIEELKYHFKVTVICLKSDISVSRFDERGSVALINVSTRENDKRLYLMNGKSQFDDVYLYFVRIWHAFKRLMRFNSSNQELTDSYLRALQEIKEPIDAIIPTIFPIEAAIAASHHKHKNPNIALYPYVFDDFVESPSLHLTPLNRYIKRPKNKIIERKIYQNSDRIISMFSRQSYHNTNHKEDINSKIIYLEHPLLVDKKIKPIHKNDTTIRIVFAGSLIKNVRDPNYAIKLLKGMRCNNSLQVDFATQGNLSKAVKSYNYESKIKIINHGQLEKEKADQLVASADILLNIGNINSKQVPGKVFEYMATGKPIIHIVYGELDYTYWMLKKYPYAISILKSYAPFHVNRDLVENFIEKYKNRRATFTEVAHIFPEALPSCTAKLIQTLLS